MGLSAGNPPRCLTALDLEEVSAGPHPPSSQSDPPGRPVGTLTLFVTLTTAPRSRCLSVTHLSTLLFFHPPIHSSLYLPTHPFLGFLPNLHFL